MIPKHPERATIGEAILHTIVVKLDAVEPADTIVGTTPQITFGIAHNLVHRGRTQAFGTTVVFEKSMLGIRWNAQNQHQQQRQIWEPPAGCKAYLTTTHRCHLSVAMSGHTVHYQYRSLRF